MAFMKNINNFFLLLMSLGYAYKVSIKYFCIKLLYTKDIEYLIQWHAKSIKRRRGLIVKKKLQNYIFLMWNRLLYQLKLLKTIISLKLSKFGKSILQIKHPLLKIIGDAESCVIMLEIENLKSL